MIVSLQHHVPHNVSDQLADSATPVRVETSGFLFDMDGVLIASIGSVNRCWRTWCERNDVPDPEAVEIPHGTRAIDIVRMLKPEWDGRQVARGLQEIEDLETADTGDVTALPGVIPLLNALPPDRWAIVTSATRPLLLARLRAAGLPQPQHVITGELVLRGKPDPEPYLRGAEALGFAPDDCIVLEDAPSGVASGVAAGCRVLGVLSTHTAPQLSHATWRIRSLADLTVTAGLHTLTVQFPLDPGDSAS